MFSDTPFLIYIFKIFTLNRSNNHQSKQCLLCLKWLPLNLLKILQKNIKAIMSTPLPNCTSTQIHSHIYSSSILPSVRPYVHLKQATEIHFSHIKCFLPSQKSKKNNEQSKKQTFTSRMEAGCVTPTLKTFKSHSKVNR